MENKIERSWTFVSDLHQSEISHKESLMRKPFSNVIGSLIKIASTNTTVMVTEHSKTATSDILTLKAIPTENAEFEVIEPKRLENKSQTK